jgi:GNAT superfamily N-acetyltransferase
MKIQQIDHSSPLYDAALNIWNAVWPNYPADREEWLHNDLNYDSKYFRQRYVLNHNKKVVAAGVVFEPWWSYKPGKLHFKINVLKELRNQGMGMICLEYIEACLKKRKGNTLTVNAKEDYVEGVKFLKNRNFSVILREPESILNVQNFNPKKFEFLFRKMKSQKIILKSLHALQSIDTNWRQNLYEFYCKIMKDVPSQNEYTERTFENFKKQKLSAPGFDPKANFIALDEGKYVGLSSLWRQKSRPKVFWTELTGVIRSHRRRKIALALKVQAVLYAIQCGANQIETDNEENNPMLKINQKLGFIDQPAWLTLEKHYE